MEKMLRNDKEMPLYGDTLAEILSRVPLIELVPASYVAKSWKSDVAMSLRHLNTPKPWLILHSQNTRSNVVTTHAYDPRSDLWMKRENSEALDACIRSSHGNLLYVFSSSRLSFSLDPLHTMWHHVNPPKIWRVDPIVAAVGRHIIVAGGACDFEQYIPLPMEIYNLDSATWTTCGTMPEALKGSTSPSWLSAATDGHKLFLTEKQSGVTHTFDPITKSWSKLFDLSLLDIFYSINALVDDRFVLIGLIGDVEKVNGLKLWRVDGERFEEIGEMPKGFLEKFMGENSPFSSIGVCSAQNFLYIYSNSLVADEIFLCEIGRNGCKWRTIQNVVALGGNGMMKRMTFTCSDVGIDDVYNSFRSQNGRFIRF